MRRGRRMTRRGGSGGVISATGRRVARWAGRPGSGSRAWTAATRRRRRRIRQRTRRRTGRASWIEGRPGRVVVSAERVAAEQRALREAVAGLLAGLTNQSKVAREWNAAGLLTTTGQLWTTTAVRDTLLRPILAGRIEHEGELISHVPGEPIIVERDWLRLRAMTESRRRGRPRAERYLGSGVLRCGACGKQLGGQVVTRAGAGSGGGMCATCSAAGAGCRSTCPGRTRSCGR